jgi:hypothetical protein
MIEAIESTTYNDEDGLLKFAQIYCDKEFICSLGMDEVETFIKELKEILYDEK